MPMEESSLNLSFNIDKISTIGVPVSQNVNNQFDEFGFITDTKRLDAESNLSFKDRILDTYVHRANSTYRGLIYGITRDFGLSITRPIRIYPIKNSNIFLAADPAVILNGPNVTLYSDVANNIIELSFDRYDQDGEAYLILDLVNYINNNSTLFRADILLPERQYDRSMTLLTQNNMRIVRQELLPQSNRFQLEFPGMDKGKIINKGIEFNDTVAFHKRVYSFNEVLRPGDWYIDLHTGDVMAFSVPADGSFVRYKAIINNWKLEASPVIIHNIQNEYFQKKIFEQVLTDLGTEVNGLPTPIGADIINELMSVYPLYFSK